MCRLPQNKWVTASVVFTDFWNKQGTSSRRCNKMKPHRWEKRQDSFKTVGWENNSSDVILHKVKDNTNYQTKQQMGCSTWNLDSCQRRARWERWSVSTVKWMFYGEKNSTRLDLCFFVDSLTKMWLSLKQERRFIVFAIAIVQIK